MGRIKVSNIRMDFRMELLNVLRPEKLNKIVIEDNNAALAAAEKLKGDKGGILS